MLKKITIKNFYSLKDVTVDFSCDKNSSNAVPILGMFGLNGAGKSTIIKAIKRLGSFMRNEHIDPFVRSNADNPTSFALDFIVDKEEYSYFICFGEGSNIIEEALYSLGECIFDYGENVETDYCDEISTNKDLNEVLISALKEKSFKPTFPFLRNGGLYKDLNEDIYKVYNYITGLKGGVNSIPDDVSFINEMLPSLDVGINSIKWIKEIAYNYPLSVRLNGSEKMYGDFACESKGIKEIVYFLADVQNVLENGGILLCDNYGAFVHPIISKKLLEIFTSKTLNPHQAQLLFASHNTFLMNYLANSEIAIVSKTKDGTTFKRICDFEGNHYLKNIEKSYLNGEFGGIPFPYLNY